MGELGFLGAEFAPGQARRLTDHACELFRRGEECVTEVSMAKLFATEMVDRVAYQAVQLHGGYGYTREFPVEWFARNDRRWTTASGSSEICARSSPNGSRGRRAGHLAEGG